MHIFIIVGINCKSWHDTFVHIKMCSWWRSIQNHWLKMHSKFIFEPIFQTMCVSITTTFFVFLYLYYYYLQKLIFTMVNYISKTWDKTLMSFEAFDTSMCAISFKSFTQSIVACFTMVYSEPLIKNAFKVHIRTNFNVIGSYCVLSLRFTILFSLFFNYYYFLNWFIMWTVLYFTECSDGNHGFDCVDHCETCNNTLCERFEGNCTHGCIEGFKGHHFSLKYFL
jgi:hypothetical protein